MILEIKEKNKNCILSFTMVFKPLIKYFVEATFFLKKCLQALAQPGG